MALGESARRGLFERLEAVLGEEHATVLMDQLPAEGWSDIARKRDLEVLEARLQAAFHKDMNLQTRAMMFGLATTFVGLAGVVLAATG